MTTSQPSKAAVKRQAQARFHDIQHRLETVGAVLQEHLAIITAQIAEAYAERDWEALGMKSWDAYCVALGIPVLAIPDSLKLEITGKLSDKGATQREIAVGTNVSKSTAARNESRARPGRVAAPAAASGPSEGTPALPQPPATVEPRSLAPDGADDLDNPGEIVDAVIVPDEPGNLVPGSGPLTQPPLTFSVAFKAFKEAAEALWDAEWEERDVDRILREMARIQKKFDLMKADFGTGE